MIDADTNDCGCKVGRAIDRYGLEGLNEQLLERRSEEGRSLRDLADDVNRAVLSAAVGGSETTGRSIVYEAVSEADAIDRLYAALQDDASASQRARIGTRLGQAGIDVDALTDRWVTHTTVRRHLNECLDVDTSRESSITVADGVNTVEWTRRRSQRIAEDTLGRLRNADLVAYDEPPEVRVAIRVTCRSCGATHALSDFVQSGGCSCRVADGAGPSAFASDERVDRSS